MALIETLGKEPPPHQYLAYKIQHGLLETFDIQFLMRIPQHFEYFSEHSLSFSFPILVDLRRRFVEMIDFDVIPKFF